MDLLVGLDIGTSTVKAGLFDRLGNLLAVARAPQPIHSPQPGWAEQDPSDWWSGACQVLSSIMGSAGSNAVLAIGLSGQCPGHVLVDAQGEALGSAIIWRDRRAQAEADWIGAHLSPEEINRWTGSGLLSDPTLPPARLLWLRDHRPDDWSKARAVLQPKDFIAQRLTGEIGTDLYSAYCLANPETGMYDPDYLQILNVPGDILPPIYKPTTEIGKVTRSASLVTGLPAGTPVFTGTIDAWCDNLAGGVLFEGRAVDVAGTSEMISLGVTGRPGGKGVFLADLGMEGRFLCGPTQSGGDTLRWLGRGFYPEMGQKMEFDRLEREASQIPAGSEGLIFLPYLSGERAPIWDPGASGVFFGLEFHHDRRHFARSIYESIGYAIRHVLETCEQAACVQAVAQRAEYVVVCGGGSLSRFWNQVKADILQRPVLPSAIADTACLGAAMLAGVGIGCYPDLRQASGQMVRFQNPLQPDPGTAESYEKNYRTYIGLYPALKAVFHQI
jgi:xylulokinase